MDEVRYSKRGPKPLPVEEKRVHTVSVRLNDVELSKLEKTRGKYQRGEWLRIAALDKLPPTIPVINQQAYAELARSAANLNQISRHLNEGGAADAATVAALLSDFRLALLGASE
ncbi:MAG: plasmid mobilization relaxosome protein MobC [Burkholderiaceae bacterium]